MDTESPEMNGILALCHFCETHGPCVIFCTQAVKKDLSADANCIGNNNNNNNNWESQVTNTICEACNPKRDCLAILSRENSGEAIFVSTKWSTLPEVCRLLKQASVRSLSCEVDYGGEGNLVFFGDSSRGHVLSHTFHLRDVHARGFYRLFSIVVLSKDKPFLLNNQPFLAENLKKISKNLQTLAENVFDKESDPDVFDRAKQQKINRTAASARTLPELTAEKNVYMLLHAQFSQILQASTKYVREHINFGQLPWHDLSQNSRTLLDGENSENESSLIYIKNLLPENYPEICYCVLVGQQVIVRGTDDETAPILLAIKLLIPEKLHLLIRQSISRYLTPQECRLISLTPDVAIPKTSSTILRIDCDTDISRPSVKWLGSIPTPSLYAKIIKGLNDLPFNDVVFQKKLNAWMQEWINKIKCLQKVKSPGGIAKMRKILGVQQQDLPIVNYWTNYLQ